MKEIGCKLGHPRASSSNDSRTEPSWTSKRLSWPQGKGNTRKLSPRGQNNKQADQARPLTKAEEVTGLGLDPNNKEYGSDKTHNQGLDLLNAEAKIQSKVKAS